jgi:dTDP-glucose 4,6-dehydratase
MKKVLVTGGAGFIGSNFVVKSLKDKPELEITVLDSLTYAGNLGNLAEVKDSITFIQGDIRDAAAVDEAVQGQDLDCSLCGRKPQRQLLEKPWVVR